MALFAHIPAHTLAQVCALPQLLPRSPSTQLSTSLSRDGEPAPVRRIVGPALDPIFDHPSCRRGNVIEITGPAASGKSHLLYHMLINCVLPPELAGWGKVAILLDTDHKFNILRFAQLLRSRVRRLLPPDRPDSDVIVTKAFSLLHVFRPLSSHQLAATIQHLPVYLATELPEEDLGVLAVDSISAFYWPDRHAHEQLRPGDTNAPPSRSANPLSHVFASITSFIQSHGPLVLLSSWDLSPLSASQRRQQLEASLPLPLADAGQHMQHQLPVACRINLYCSGIVENSLDTGDDGTIAKPLTISNLSGIVRVFGGSMVKRFALQVTEDDTFVS